MQDSDFGTKANISVSVMPPVNISSAMAKVSLGEREDGWVSYSTDGSTKNFAAGVYETDETDDNSTIYIIQEMYKTTG